VTVRKWELYKFARKPISTEFLTLKAE